MYAFISMSLSMCIYIYIYICACMYIYTYIRIHTHMTSCVTTTKWTLSQPEMFHHNWPSKDGLLHNKERSALITTNGRIDNELKYNYHGIHDLYVSQSAFRLENADFNVGELVVVMKTN